MRRRIIVKSSAENDDAKNTDLVVVAPSNVKALFEYDTFVMSSIQSKSS